MVCTHIAGHIDVSAMLESGVGDFVAVVVAPRFGPFLVIEPRGVRLKRKTALLAEEGSLYRFFNFLPQLLHTFHLHLRFDQGSLQPTPQHPRQHPL